MAAADKALRKYASQLRKHTSGDFDFTKNSLDAIFRNLATSGRGVGRQLSGEQSRILTAMSRLAARQGGGMLKSDVAQTKNMYGSALGGLVGGLYAPAKATSQATGIMSRAQAEAGVLQGKGGRTALQAQIAGAREAKSGADYALASALSQRQQEDAQAIAEQKLELEKIRLQHALDQQDQQGTQNPVFLKAQDQMTAILADPNTTYQQAQSAMRDAQIRGNLSPDQVASLQAQLDNAFPDKTGTSVLAGTPVDKDGTPLLLKPSDEQREGIRGAVAKAVDAGQSQTEALTELRTLTKDTPMTPAARAALEEYFRMVWQTYAEVTRAMQGGGRGAVSQRGAQPRRPQPTPGPR